MDGDKINVRVSGSNRSESTAAKATNPSQPVPVAPAPPPEVAAEPTEAVAETNIPKFGELQPKVDAHPLFSGQQEPPPKRSRRGLRKLSWGLGSLLALALVAYLLIDSGVVRGASHLPFHVFKQPVAVTAPVITPQKITASTTSTDPYAGWKAYTSSNTLGLNAKYPSDWSVTEKAASSQCSGAIETFFVPPANELHSALTTLGVQYVPPSTTNTGGTTGSSYTFLITKAGALSAKCGTSNGDNGTYDWKGTKLGYINSLEMVSSGIFKGSWLTFIATAGAGTAPTQALLTSQSYKQAQQLTDSGIVTVAGAQYQINVGLSTAFAQNSESVAVDPLIFQTTDLYKHTLLIINSFTQ